MDRLVSGLTAATVVLVAGGLMWVLLTDRRSERSRRPRSVQELEQVQVLDVPPSSSVKGESGARIAIVEFSDFECPFCGRYARDTYPRLTREYVDTGKVQYMFRHYPLDIHPLAIKAAEAVECAAREGMYWEMHDLLFAAGGALAEPDLLGYAATLGLQQEDFETCLKGNIMTERVLEDRQYGEALGVSATPTFFFAEVRDDGKLSLLAKLSGARPYSTFQSTLDELLSEIEATD